MPRIVADMPPKVNSDYDVSPDGQRFHFVKSNVEKGPPDKVRGPELDRRTQALLAPPGKQS